MLSRTFHIRTFHQSQAARAGAPLNIPQQPPVMHAMIAHHQTWHASSHSWLSGPGPAAEEQQQGQEQQFRGAYSHDAEAPQCVLPSGGSPARSSAALSTADVAYVAMARTQGEHKTSARWQSAILVSKTLKATFKPSGCWAAAVQNLNSHTGASHVHRLPASSPIARCAVPASALLTISSAPDWPVRVEEDQCLLATPSNCLTRVA